MLPDFASAETMLAERLSGKAMRHCRAVADTAGRLATLYGVDRDAARIAGLLHDWHRSLTHDQLLQSARDLGQEVTDAELEVPYLLHARTGAADLRNLFPELEQEILDAIERHTVGDPDMTDLDKVVYVADMIEPGRDYDGVDDLRESAGTASLDELFAASYAQSLAHLVRTRKRIHPKTIEVWNALVARKRR